MVMISSECPVNGDIIGGGERWFGGGGGRIYSECSIHFDVTKKVQVIL